MRHALLLLLLVPLGVPAAAAQADAAAVPVQFTLEHGIDAGSLEEHNCTTGPCPEGEPSCGSDHLTLAANGTAFTFSESDTGTGCAQAWMEIPVPPGTRTLTLTFWADRAIQRRTDLTGQDVPVEALQEVQMYMFGATSEPAHIPVHDATSLSQAGRVHAMTFELGDIGQQGGRVAMAWLFSDEGTLGSQNLPLPDGNVAFTATVRDVRLEVRGQMPGAAFVQDVQPRDEGAATVEAFMLEVPAPGYRGAPHLGPITSTVRFDLHAHAVEALWGPETGGQRERLAITEVQTDEDELPAAVWIRQEHADAVPGGSYGLAVVYRPPVDRASVGWLPAVLLVLPLVAGVPASRNIHTYRVEARGPYRRTARALFLTGAAAWTFYVAVAVTALLAVGWPRLARFPPDPSTSLVYVQVGVVFLGFLLLWHLAGRSYVDGMRDDLRRRDRQEQELRRSNEELERFAYVASHDLQEPLRKVAASTMMLRKRYGDSLDASADKWIGYAVDGAHRMQDMVQSLLTYSRAGQGELDMQDVDMQGLVDDVVDDLAHAIEERAAQVKVSGLPTLAADAMCMRQLFQNLIQNAIKYQRPDSTPSVRVDAVRDGAGWDIRVQDNGIGIPADKTEAVFDAFRRLHDRESYEGTGIGLAICARIVERHGGRIRVESQEGKGSTFHVWLPDRDDAARRGGSGDAQ